MKIKRYFAPDVRQAMRLVREEQGPDAVILSNKRVDGGVEIVAAVDYDETALLEQVRDGRAASAQAAASAIAQQAEAVPAISAAPRRAAHGAVTASVAAAPATHAADSAAAKHGDGEDRSGVEPTMLEMRRELQTLRRMLEGQLSSLAWGSFARGEPRRVELVQRLMQFGMTAAQSRSLVEGVVTDDADVEALWRRALDAIARALPVYGTNLLDTGGVVAVVGPTGAGKTTTAAKLAAHYALRHGKHNVALVSIDDYRVGAYEQLRTYGRLLDVPVRIAGSGAELRAIVDDLADRRLVLIDTSGMSQHDAQLARQAELLERSELDRKTLLVLPATARQSGLDAVASAFAIFAPDACVVTKVDECTCLGGVLSVSVRQQLPIAWLSDGQRVPEDLRAAEADDLVARAVQIMNRMGPLINEDLVTLSFGREIANAHL